MRTRCALFPKYVALSSCCRIKDKNGDTALDLVHSSDDEIKRLIRKSRAEAALSLDDVTNGESSHISYPSSLFIVF